MADSNLNVPVIIQATRLDTSVLPRNIFSQSYLLYVIAQGTDVGNVANKANEAGQGAYDAQVRNDEQDVILVDHEIRLASAEAKIQDHETRITNAESAIPESGKYWSWRTARSGKRRADICQQHESDFAAKCGSCRC